MKSNALWWFVVCFVLLGASSLWAAQPDCSELNADLDGVNAATANDFLTKYSDVSERCDKLAWVDGAANQFGVPGEKRPLPGTLHCLQCSENGKSKFLMVHMFTGEGTKGFTRHREPTDKCPCAAKESDLDSIVGSTAPHELPSVLGRLARHYTVAGNLKGAEEVCQRLLKIRENTAGKDSVEVAASLIDLASVYLKQARESEASQLMTRAEKTFTESRLNNQWVAESLSRLARLELELKKYPAAEGLFKRAIQVTEQKWSDETFKRVALLNILPDAYFGLAETSLLQNQEKEALAYLEKCLESIEKFKASVHDRQGRKLNDFGELLEKTGRVSEAEKAYERSLTVLAKDPFRHMDVSSQRKRAHDNLARIYRQTGKQDKLVELERKAQTDRQNDPFTELMERFKRAPETPQFPHAIPGRPRQDPRTAPGVRQPPAGPKTPSQPAEEEI